MNQPVRVGQRITLKIDELAYSPDGIGRFENFIVFVPYSAPGDELEVLITEVRKNFSRGKIEKILKPSPDRIETPCRVFGECGGCHWQHLNYQKQLDYKEKIVRNALRAFEDVKIEKAIPADEHYYYRNKSQFPVDVPGKKAGLFALKSHYVVDIENCPLILRKLNDIYGFVKRYLVKNNYPIPNLRHVVVRGSETKEDAAIVLVLRDGSLDEATKLANLLREEFKDISVLFNLNNTETNIIMGSQTIMMFGDGSLTEEWPDIRYKISPISFFQTNTTQMRKMYDLVSGLVTEDLTAEACDLYCGAGTISLLIAKKFRKVIGIDEVKPAIADAKINAELNKIENCEFLNGRVEDITTNSLTTGYRPKTVVLDPPRKGCEKSVLLNIKKLGAKEIIYVSCDVMTLARDLLILREVGYKPVFIQPLDMFPNTFHVEVIVKLVPDESFKAKEPAPELPAIEPVIIREKTVQPVVAKAEPAAVKVKKTFAPRPEKVKRKRPSAGREERKNDPDRRPSARHDSESRTREKRPYFGGTSQRDRKYVSSARSPENTGRETERSERSTGAPVRKWAASKNPYSKGPSHGSRTSGSAFSGKTLSERGGSYKGRSEKGKSKGFKRTGPSKTWNKGNGRNGGYKGRKDDRR